MFAKNKESDRKPVDDDIADRQLSQLQSDHIQEFTADKFLKNTRKMLEEIKVHLPRLNNRLAEQEFRLIFGNAHLMTACLMYAEAAGLNGDDAYAIYKSCLDHIQKIAVAKADNLS